MVEDAPYPMRQALRLTGLPRRFVDDLVAQGVVTPRDGQHFSHRDVVVLRTARELRDAGVPPRKVVQALRNLQSALAPDPLSGVRLRAHAGHVEARIADRQRIDAQTGQALLPFDEAEGASAGIRPLPLAADAAQWLQRALTLEAQDRGAAEAAYRRALALDAGCAPAYINLGALLCEAGRCGEAVELYDQALESGVSTALVHFNRATALEDLDRPWQAVFAYKRALELEPTLADAHHNLGMLLQRLGDHQGSLRHLSAYRRYRR